MKTKRTLIIAGLAMLFALAFTSCERENLLAQTMSSGDGIWVIEKIQYTYYDSTGAVVADSTQERPGEFVFFDSETLDALYNYHACVYNEYDADGNIIHATPCQFFTDKNRFDIDEAPASIEHTYTVVKWGSKKQEWVYTQNGFNNNSGSALSMEMRVFIEH